MLITKVCCQTSEQVGINTMNTPPERDGHNIQLLEKLLTITNSISDGVFTVDLDFRITFFNKAAERITGYSQKEVIGKPCREIFHTNVCEEACPLQKTISTGKPIINQPVCTRNKSGQRLPVSISTALLKDDKGTIIGGVETFRDLSVVENLRKDFEARYTFEHILSRNHRMLELFKILPAIAESGSTVLIEGESGTGKELFAHALHNLSPRTRGPFVAVNCGALPDTLLEAELFGYKAGAFTDAKKDKQGYIATAKGGTLFLDEIGDISSAMQVKLLRVLQERTYHPLGATQAEEADVRIITATNKQLDALVRQGEFRQDFYYRINVVKIVIPPLRERIEDIPLLAEHFIGQFNRLRHKDISGLSPDAMNILMNHDFPGNIRELENIIEHAFIMSPGGIIRPEHLPSYLHNQPRPIPVVEVASTWKEMEALFIIAALKRNNWSRKATAKELGINPSTLYRRIQRLGITIPKQAKR